ncbi:MAG: SoxR reducing system RseC family protein [Candidatus Saganbacteria bacterium]|nr:SoxR reducing system RseC family protein [Candidatus Saganbacteria bacterium]
MKTKGKISKLLSDDIVEVICEPNSACEKCKGCSMSSSGEIILKAKNNMRAKVGDGVEVEVEEAEGIRAAFIVFIFPIIGLLFGYFIGTKFSSAEYVGVIGALVFMVITFLFLNLYDRYLSLKNECSAVIIKAQKG